MIRLVYHRCVSGEGKPAASKYESLRKMNDQLL